MRKILYSVVFCFVMLAIIAPINAPTSITVAARTQQPAYVKTGVFEDMEMMLSRIFPFYKADSWLNTRRNDFDARSFLMKLGLSDKLIVPTQEPGKTSVSFKGWVPKEGVAKEGTVSLVLKIYDQASAGTKLYEGTHDVEVTQGQYFANIQVPSETVARRQTIWLEAASVEEKELAFEPRQPFILRPPQGVITNAIRSVALCYSCGGSAPFRAGEIPVPSGNPTEHGAQCALPLMVRTDYRPYLCAGFE
jgi:hypothetical protein